MGGALELKEAGSYLFSLSLCRRASNHLNKNNNLKRTLLRAGHLAYIFWFSLCNPQSVILIVLTSRASLKSRDKQEHSRDLNKILPATKLKEFAFNASPAGCVDWSCFLNSGESSLPPLSKPLTAANV